MSQKKGFTVVEVALVLAIAGLIFLMVFVALPALNRSQRDAQRREDMMLFLKKVKDYQTNNRGALPDSDEKWQSVIDEYIGGNFEDPSGGKYTFSVNPSVQLTDSSPFSTEIKIFKASTCNGQVVTSATNLRKIAIQYKMEGGGVFCVNS